VNGFSLSELYFLCRGNHIVDFFGENAHREVADRTLPSSTVELWSRGCAHLPSPGVKTHEVGARGWSVGQAPAVSEGGTDYW
jgi:hypothetical protein